MGIFNEFNKKEKPVFTGSRFGFGSGGGGGAAAASGPSPGILAATGGSVYTSGDYKLHVFRSDNTPENFVVSSAAPDATVEIMMIGGGGSGGPDQGSGGGAGGLVWTNNGGIVIADGTYPVAVPGASQDDAPGPSNPSNARGGDVTFNFGGSGIVLTGKGGGFGGYFPP